MEEKQQQEREMENRRARRSGVVVCDRCVLRSLVTPDSALARVPKRLS